MAPDRPADAPYHHGDVRAAAVAAAVEALAEGGPGSLRLRDVARRAGVSHSAVAYHVGDRAGLLTAVAAEGYRLLAERLAAALEEHASFLEVGVAYVCFAVEHRAHFEVMYRPDLLHADDPELVAARAETAELLYGTAEADPDQLAAGVAAWAIVHGIATLWLDGNLPAALGDDPAEVTRIVARHLRRPG